MAVAVIADAHVGGPGGPAAVLVSQLEALPRSGCRHLVLLGDLFHVWVGSRRFETADIRAVVEALHSLREMGVRIDYIEGNRDFFIADSSYRDAFDHVGYEVAFSESGVNYLGVHGDGLDDSDRAYRAWRWLSKSRLSRFCMMHLPRWLAERAMMTTERQLSKTNFKHKTHIPEEVLKRYGELRLAGSCDVLLVGHFHSARNWTVEGGEVRLIEAWFRTHRIEWLGDPPGGS